MGQRLDADAEHALQGEELAEGERAAALADLEPQRLAGHEERPGEAVRDPLGVETAGHVEHDVAELVGDGEPLPLAPVLGVHDDDADGRQSRPARPGGEAAHGVERQGKYLDAPFFEQLHQVGHGLVAQPPVAA